MPTALLHDPSALARNRPSRIDYPPPICDHASARRRAIATFERILKRPGRSLTETLPAEFPEILSELLNPAAPFLRNAY